MASERQTAIERLEPKHPGITQDVNDRFLSGFTGEEMLKYLAETYDVTEIPLSTIYYHRVTRTQAWKDEIREKKVAFAAMSELVDEKGLDDAAKAKLWEAVESMSPESLIRLRGQQIERDKLVIQIKQLDVKNRELETTVERMAREQRQREGKVEEIVQDEKVDPAEVRRRIKEIFGM